jgi:hypothetical protein
MTSIGVAVMTGAVAFTDTVYKPTINVSVSEYLLWLFVVLTPLQDTILQSTPMKLLVASPAVLPLSALLFLRFSRILVRLSMRRVVLVVFAYIALVCLANLFNPGLEGLAFDLKAFVSYGFSTTLILFAVFGVNYKDSRGFRAAVYMAFGITILGIAVNVLMGPNAIPALQATTTVNDLSDRLRGFSTEPGSLSIEIVTIGMLTAHLLRRSWQKWCSAAATCGLLVWSTAKGGLICLLLCAIVLPIVRSKSSIWIKLLIACIVTPVIWLGALISFSQFNSLVETNQTATIATRLSMIVYALITVAHNPFGVGFTGFLPSIPRYLPQAMEFIQSLFPFGLWFQEVREYLDPPYVNADCKTFFFDFLAFFGIPFAIAFFVFTYRLLRQLLRCGCYSLFVGVLFSIFALIAYYSLLNAFAVPLLFGVAVCETKRHQASLRVY